MAAPTFQLEWPDVGLGTLRLHRAGVLQRDGIVWFDADGYKGGPRAAALATLKLRLADERTNKVRPAADPERPSR